MARKTRSHSRTITRTKTRKHRNNHNHKHKHSKSCTCKYCSSAKKGSRTHTRSRRGGTQTAVGGNMIYKGGQWYSYNPVGGRS
jgi:hypothetical protein